MNNQAEPVQSPDQTLLLLQEARDYLLRLPVVPTTRELARRIGTHLEQLQSAPAQRVVMPNAAGIWKGGVYTQAGEPILTAIVNGRTLQLHPGRLGSLDDEQRFLSTLSRNVTIALNRS